MFDTENFIISIQNQPNIWNISSKNCSDRDERKFAWETVGKVKYKEEWDHLSTTEKDAKSKFYVYIYLSNTK